MKVNDRGAELAEELVSFSLGGSTPIKAPDQVDDPLAFFSQLLEQDIGCSGDSKRLSLRGPHRFLSALRRARAMPSSNALISRCTHDLRVVEHH
jgi:hypothetical protein